MTKHVNVMQQKRTRKKQVTYRLDSRLIDCIDGLRATYPRFSATDIVDLMLKGFLATHDIGIVGGPERMDKVVGQYLRGDLDRSLDEMYDLYARRAQASQPSTREEE